MFFYNNKGQAAFFILMLVITIAILALALAPALKENIDTTRDGMDCNNSSISKFDKVNCIVADTSQFYFIGGLIALAGMLIGAKIVLQ